MADGISATATIVKKSAIALKFLGVALLLYIGGVAIYAYSQFSSTKTKLLTYGLSDATGNLLAYTVMLVALALPVMAVVRFFIGTPRPRDWATAMVLPLASWAMAQLPANFDATTGEALKYCAKRPSGELFCLDRPGVDPLTQRQLKKMDSDLAEREIRKKDNLMPKQITVPVGKVEFFDSLSDPSKPEPKVWVVEDGKGCYTLFDHPGVDPTTGDALKPVTKQIVREIKKCVVATVEQPATGSAAQSATAQPAAAANTGSGLTAPPATTPVVQPAPATPNTAELDRQRREAAAETQRRLQSDLAELTRTRDQESRAAESEYRQAELTARNARSSAHVELQRRHQQEQVQARTSCDLQSKALAKLGPLGALAQGGCQQTQGDIEARFQQGNLDVEANYQAALKAAQDTRAERLAEIRDRFERTRMELAQAAQR